MRIQCFVCCVAAFVAVDEKKMPDRVRPGIDAGQRKLENQPTIIPPKP
jgi:hypothetical protein